MVKNRLAVFFPTTKNVIKTVLEFANLKKGDVLYDLGSGDGRILIEAAKANAKVVGIEKSRLLNKIAKRRTKGLKNVNIIQGNIFDQDISEADVLVAYLSRRLTHDLKEKIHKESKKGTRVILIDHPFNGWEPVEVRKVGIMPVRLYVR